jgi:hypothetical protein
LLLMGILNASFALISTDTDEDSKVKREVAREVYLFHFHNWVVAWKWEGHKEVEWFRIDPFPVAQMLNKCSFVMLCVYFLCNEIPPYNANSDGIYT